MRLYNCGGTDQSFNHSSYHSYQSRPLAFDFKNYRIQWDPRVEEYVNKLKQSSTSKRIVGLEEEDDDEDDDDEDYSIDEDDDDEDYSIDDEDVTLPLSRLSLKPTAPILTQFKN